MKSIKIIAIALLIATSTVFAHGGHGVYRGNINTSGTHFVKGMSGESWNNSNTPTSTKANYADFDGETFVSLVSYDKQSEIVLESRVKVAKGELCIIVENSQGEMLFAKSFDKDETITATLTLDVYEQYKIRFIGEATKGSYQCKWTQQ